MRSSRQTKDDLVALLADWPASDLAAVLSDWEVWARDDQLPPHDRVDTRSDDETLAWRTWLILGGRGAGKTRAGAEWIRAQALGRPPFADEPAMQIALVGETMHDVRTVMVEGVSGLLAVHPDDERPDFEPSKGQLTWPNGAIARIYSAETPDSLRGPQFAAAWCDEIAKWRNCDGDLRALARDRHAGPARGAGQSLASPLGVRECIGAQRHGLDGWQLPVPSNCPLRCHHRACPDDPFIRVSRWRLGALFTLQHWL